jgi:FKBP-type peptidyl-prolyl cis-trans isomerase FkpA
MKHWLLTFLTIGLLAAACKKPIPTDDCNYDPCAIKASNTEIAQLENYIASANITGAVKHCSGMYYQVLSDGSGTAPGVCSVVTVNYKGMLTTGAVFDSTSTTPISFTLLLTIEGWKKGVPLIHKGGKIRLYIPPSLGYGANAIGQIPANSILIFDVELVDVQ